MLVDGKQMHIKITKGDIGEYVILPGDPARCEKIANFFEMPKKLSSNREYTVYSGFLNGVKVGVCSTGIGGPSAAIAIEELVECGAHTFIRVGTSGGMQDNVIAGDICIATSAIRQEGTSKEYMPIEFPAVANFDVTLALKDAAQALGYRHHLGVIQSKDSFYGELRPKIQPIAKKLEYQWNAWKEGGALTSEMEAATLFVVSSVLKVRCGAVLNVLWNADNDETNTISKDAEQRGVKTAIKALEFLIERDLKK